MVIYNRFIPFGRYAAINLCGLIFVKRGVIVPRTMLNHEAIHTAQQLEMGILPFFLWYVCEWLFKLPRYRNPHKAYHAIGFEREAYANEHNPKYLQQRRHYAWLPLLRTSNKPH